MKTFSFFLLLTISLSGYSQKPVKDFHLKKSMKQETLQYQFTVLDEDKRGVRRYDKSKFYFWYKAQKVLSTQGGASGQLLHGELEVYHDNKQLAQKGKFCKGLKDGKWTYWRTDGTLIVIENWNKGKLTKTKEDFNENGESRQLTKYSLLKYTRENKDSVMCSKNNGELKSICIKGENGELIEKQYFKNGELKDVKKYSKERNTSTGLATEVERGKKKGEPNSDKVPFFKKIFKKKEQTKDKSKKEPKTDKNSKDKKTIKSKESKKESKE